MLQALYTTRSGMQSQQRRIDVIADNVANINTVGFKSSTVSFKDTLYSNLVRPVGQQEDYNLKQGTGVTIAAITRSFIKGLPIRTDVTLDTMIDGEGFFQVQDSNGDIGYTRNGAFNVSTEEDGNYLVTASGDYVLDENQEKIELSGNPEDVVIGAAGDISIDGVDVATLGVVTFVNKGGLESIGASTYMQTDASGGPVDVDNVNIKQGYLESSNVDTTTELTRLIRAQRSSSLSAAALKTVDSMMGTANNLRR